MGSSKKILIVLGVVVLLIGVGLVYLFYQKSKSVSISNIGQSVSPVDKVDSYLRAEFESGAEPIDNLKI